MIPSYQIEVTEDSPTRVTLHIVLPHRLEISIPLSRWDANQIAHAIRTDTPIPYRIIRQTGLEYQWHGKVARKRVTIALHYDRTQATITLGFHETKRLADLLASAPAEVTA